MLTAQTRITTDRASRYLVQLCRHVTAIASGTHPFIHRMPTVPDAQIRAEWCSTRGTITFTPWGRCTLVADADTLTVRIEAEDADRLRQIQDILTDQLGRFDHPDTPAITWLPTCTPAASTPVQTCPNTTGPTTGQSLGPKPHIGHPAVAAALAPVLALVFHLVAGGVPTAGPGWTGTGSIVGVALLLMKIALVTVRTRILHRRVVARAHG
jgi:hypothetical protein